MFTIAASTRQNLIEVTLSDLMSAAEAKRYVDDVRRAFIRHRIRGGYRMVIDVTECPIQSQDVVRAMAEHMATMPKAAALAVVTGGSLARMQVRRLFTQPYARIVATVAEGRAWVLHGVEPPRDAAAA